MNSFWPYLLIITNDNWTFFIIPGVIVIFNYFLYKKNFAYHPYLFLLLPLIHPAYIFFPVIYWLFSWSQKYLTVFAVISLLIIITRAPAFYPYSVFTPDPLRFDTLVKKINLIPNRSVARIFQNKTTVPLEKFSSNLFLFLDPNNYFFALHPRELVGENQNLQKFPYWLIIFFLIGIYQLPKNKDAFWIFSVFFAAALSISLLNRPDKYDFLVFFPVCLIIFSGLKYVFSKQA